MNGLGVRVGGLALVAVLGATSDAAAQEDGFLRGAAGYVGAGVSRIATGELNERLGAEGYPTFGRTSVGINVGAYAVLHSGLMLGGEWHGLIIGDDVHDGRDVGIGGGYGTLGVGYLLEVSPRLRVYPRLGLGGGGMGLWFEGDSIVDFDDVLEEPQPAPRRQPVLSTGTGVIDIGGGAEFLVGGWARGVLVGVRLGYLAAPWQDGDWQLYDVDVTGGPEASVGGPYIRVLVGLGGAL